MAELKEGLEEGDLARVEAHNARDLGETRPFHWFAEFPEVFEQGGFDAIVGNPPFMGGQHLTGTFGEGYREYLVEVVADGKRGSADYVSYFVLRAADLLRSEGFAGLLATNTVAQGDTRENGLDQLAARRWRIYAADKSRPWPGTASNEYARVHLTRADWAGERVLDGVVVPFAISPSLDSGPVGQPQRLEANAGLSFQGCNILGLGFTMTPEEAQEWIRKDARNAEVLRPYLNGKDLNSHPDQSPSRWVIDFRDWSLEKAKRWPELVAIAEDKVKNEREGKSYSKSARDRWWLFERSRPELRNAINKLERMLCRAEVSQYNLWAFVDTSVVPSHMLVVVASEDPAMLAILQSAVHEAWLQQWASSMRSDTRYTPSDCFETFPFPQESSHPALRVPAKRFLDARRACLVQRQIGLTDLWNLVHKKGLEDPDVVALREAIVTLDRAVLDAYNWTKKVDLEHGWHERIKVSVKDGREVTKRIPRYGISDRAARELVQRLYELNKKRHEAETSATGMLF